MGQRRALLFVLMGFLLACSSTTKSAEDIQNNEVEGWNDAKVVDGILQDTQPNQHPGGDSSMGVDGIHIYDDIYDTGNPDAVTCCQTDDDCGPNHQCVLPIDGDEGQCRPTVIYGMYCYSTADCLDSYVCEGEKLCGCPDECTEDACEELSVCVTTPGYCVPVDSGCCQADSECPEGTRCINNSNEVQGTCLPVATGPHPPAEFSMNFGACWDDSDCGAEHVQCYGATQCPCGEECDAPANKFGQCVLAGFKECMAEHSSYECGGDDCTDALHYWVYYPKIAGDFPAGAKPPEDLQSQMVAMHTCGGCNCEHHWYKYNGGLEYTVELANVEEFCSLMVMIAWEVKCGAYCGPEFCQGRGGGMPDHCMTLWESDEQ